MKKNTQNLFISSRLTYENILFLDSSQDTPPTLRPGNPTPGHATGQGSPAPIRPTNPTPAHAMKTDQSADRPAAPTPKEAGGGEEVPESSSQVNYNIYSSSY